MPACVLLAAASGPRVVQFKAAYSARFGAAPEHLSWSEFAAAPDRLGARLGEGAYLRIDTPDDDAAALAAIYSAGEAMAQARGAHILARAHVSSLSDGAIGSPTQWAFGVETLLRRAASIARERGAAMSTDADDAACAFDKTATVQRLNVHGLRTAPMLSDVRDFDAIEASMQRANLRRVFIKLRHGSAAAGMIALAMAPSGWRAVTTAEFGPDGALFATRRVRTLTLPQDIRTLINRLAPLGLHVEAWLPKLGLGNQASDVRVVAVRGAGVVPVVRLSPHPMTNLHLGGARAHIDLLQARIGDAGVTRVVALAQSAAQVFPGLASCGVDVAVLASGRSEAVLEVNAFGDFVQGVTHLGRSAHDLILDGIADATSSVRVNAQ